MTAIGTIESLWRYPVKSMSGEAMTEAFVRFSGFYGDRCFAFLVEGIVTEGDAIELLD